ncbi:hypothetical protein F5X68DRAFT_214941 [Plectosphaerella plurivora]|uniref:Uncharacterized protein n=1 Tax=Plectosphaerella plurivora TaxID=936078 RepID=A0A9P8V573_9PEZI|nr:hypothetical protein F5X68DRAFT_214941 [Plectosphaerella plurivora]
MAALASIRSSISAHRQQNRHPRLLAPTRPPQTVCATTLQDRPPLDLFDSLSSDRTSTTHSSAPLLRTPARPRRSADASSATSRAAAPSSRRLPSRTTDARQPTALGLDREGLTDNPPWPAMTLRRPSCPGMASAPWASSPDLDTCGPSPSPSPSLACDLHVRLRGATLTTTYYAQTTPPASWPFPTAFHRIRPSTSCRDRTNISGWTPDTHHRILPNDSSPRQP